MNAEMKPRQYHNEIWKRNMNLVNQNIALKFQRKKALKQMVRDNATANRHHRRAAKKEHINNGAYGSKNSIFATEQRLKPNSV